MIPLPPSIRIGTSASIEVQTDDGTREYKSRIEDIENNLLHVAMPSERGQVVVIPTGQYVTLSVLTPSAANLFVEGEVMGRRAQPFPVLIVRPMSVESHQQRLFHRVQVRIEPSAVWWWTGSSDSVPAQSLPSDGVTASAASAASAARTRSNGTTGAGAEANGAAGGAAGEHEEGVWQKINGTIVDLSGGGLGLLSDTSVPRDALIQIRFPLPVTAEVLEARGRVMVCRPRPQGPRTKYQLGIMFEDLPKADQERLVRANHQYQIEERRKARGV